MHEAMRENGNGTGTSVQCSTDVYLAEQEELEEALCVPFLLLTEEQSRLYRADLLPAELLCPKVPQRLKQGRTRGRSE